MKRLIMTALLLLLPFSAFSAKESNKESVEELMMLMDMDSILDTMYSHLEQAAPDMAKGFGVDPSEQESFDRFMTRYINLMKEEMNWDKMKGPMIEVYQKNLTEKEVQDMLVFYKSESGQSMIKKMPAITKDSMVVSQSLLKDFYPKLQALAEQFKEEIRAEKEQQARKPKQKETL
jgi:uncharacterized protein